MKKTFVVGTGTDVGKTYITGLIVKKLHAAGLNAAYYKAAMSGNERDENGNLIPGDAKHVKDVSGISQSLEQMCPYIYETAVSPHLASRLEGNPVQLDVVRNGFLTLASKYDYITIEGSGGIVCPICFDEACIGLVDVIRALDSETILIADAGLGTINSVVLTYEYMKTRNIPIKGIIFNNYVKGDVMHEDNIRMCQYFTGIPVLALVENGAQDIDIDINILISVYS